MKWIKFKSFLMVASVTYLSTILIDLDTVEHIEINEDEDFISVCFDFKTGKNKDFKISNDYKDKFLSDINWFLFRV